MCCRLHRHRPANLCTSAVSPPEDDRLEVTTPHGQRFTFSIAELQASRRAPRPSDLERAADLPPTRQLWTLKQPRRATEEHAIVNDLK